MECRRLGMTGLSVSCIGFGCVGMSGFDYGQVKDEESVAAVHRALDLGINLFDTADVYGLGHAEEVLGQALRGREGEALIATKFGVAWDAQGKTRRDISPKRVKEALDASLRRLGVDCIPLYQIHGPDGATPLADTLEALEECRKAGKILHIGCCNFPPDRVAEGQAYARIESIQIPYSLAQRDFEIFLEGKWADTEDFSGHDPESLIRTCSETYNMSILAYSVLAQGIFTGKFGPGATFGEGDRRRRDPLFQPGRYEKALELLARLRAVGEKYRRPPAHIAIQWALSNPSIASALAGIKTPAQANENAAAAEFVLAADDRAYLEGRSELR